MKPLSLLHRPQPGRTLLALLTSCLVTFTGTALAQDDPAFSPVEESDEIVPVDVEIDDPFEGLNRGIFWVNDKLDVYVAEPLARGYRWILPDPVERSVTDFFSHWYVPQYLVNDLLQGKIGQFGHHLTRFGINTTLGLGGILDVATDMGFEHHYEDFGTTFGTYGIDGGPYLMLPLLGPSNLRDALGSLADGAIDPITLVSYTNAFNSEDQFIFNISARGLYFIDKRAGLLEAVESAKEASLDYYLFVQSAYYQYRRGVIYDGNIPGESDWDDDDIFDDMETDVMTTTPSASE